ncbi:MAG: mitochondrial fission ELM1 family protein, partial [Candidatus Omnitrophica bacterium]|nr:mitochondrial fission ELM1 family protein [Candidatus Omnitrophota bacterium]
FIGRAIGRLGYLLDSKHTGVAYRNLRLAFSDKYSIPQLKAMLRKNYENFGMNIVETLRLSGVNQGYIKRYIKIKGKENMDNALRNKKGAIILGSHFGSWEISLTMAGILNYPFYMLTEEQSKNPLLDAFLNRIREKYGTGILKAGELRQIIKALKENKLVGIVTDHGIKEGVFIDFFGRKVRTSTIAARISLQLNVPILITYLRRARGPEHELVILPPLLMNKALSPDQAIAAGLEKINKITEEYIRKNPEQYFWFYKRFKYSRQRNILLLHDGKAGHVRQLQAVSGFILEEAKKKDLDIEIKEVEVRFRNKFSSILQALSLGLSRRGQCRGCSWCIKHFLLPKTFKELESYYADLVVSCGSSSAAVNLALAAENQAKSVVLMRPGALSTKRFDLIIMPRHDNPAPGKNIVQSEGALNLINERYINSQAANLKSRVKIEEGLLLGLLLGGDTKRFKLDIESLKPLLTQVKSFLEKHDARILITTSRRTPSWAEALLKQEFGNYSRCKLLVIANEENIPEAVGGILGLSKIVVVSPESISMISEAASSGRYVVVFNPPDYIGIRHNRFLQYFSSKKYIYLTKSSNIFGVLDEIITQKPEIVKLEDGLPVKQALTRLL